MEAGRLELAMKVFRTATRNRARNARTASDPALNLEWVWAAAELHQAAERNLWEKVDVAHRSDCSWSMIGKALGVSGQAAHQRFTKPPRSQLV